MHIYACMFLYFADRGLFPPPGCWALNEEGRSLGRAPMMVSSRERVLAYTKCAAAAAGLHHGRVPLPPKARGVEGRPAGHVRCLAGRTGQSQSGGGAQSVLHGKLDSGCFCVTTPSCQRAQDDAAGRATLGRGKS